MYERIKFIKSVSVLCVTLILMGCATEEESHWPTIDLQNVNISLDTDANMDSATAIDLLMVYDRDLTRAVMKLRAKDYFASAQQLKRDYPDMLDVIHYELTPGQAVRGIRLPMRDDPPFAAIVFADYVTQGTHRIRVGSGSEINIRLRRYDFCIIEQGCDPVHHDKNYAEDVEQTAAIRATLKREQNSQRDNPSFQGVEKVVEEAEKDGAQVKKVSSVVNNIKKIFK